MASSKQDKLRTAILFSGGKDSSLALEYALKYFDVKCLIIMVSENPESYMFHTPNIRWAAKQAEAIGLPCIVQKTKGEKEAELKDLTKAIKSAITKYKIDAVVTGAIESVYQASRVQAITQKLKIECFNPLWQKNQIELLEELVRKKYDAIIVGTFAYGMDKLIGRKIDALFIKEVKFLMDKLKINPAGEGGELESFTLNAPYFKRPLGISKSNIVKDKDGGVVISIEELS
jgi:ABC transporter with metal-binding/Fe-S-binding domain ATP-binding protein